MEMTEPVRAAVQSAVLCWLATADADGRPSVSPKEIFAVAVSYTHLRAHETVLDLVCRLLLEKKTNTDTTS